MREIAFTKAHGCGNDFLIVAGWPADYPRTEDFVRTICDRHFGVGADGLYFLSGASQPGADAAITLYNSDGSHAELSGNGTRVVAAVLLSEPGRAGPCLRIETGAGLRELRLVEREGTRFRFRMQVGPASVAPGPENTIAIWLGNPQCVVLVENFDIDWQAWGRVLGKHAFFPAGTNVDFVRVIDRSHVEARFWERGAGHTLASGTGSTASAIAAIHAGLCDSPVAVQTEGGILDIEWRPGEDAYLTGPAEIICRGVFYWS